MNKYVRIGLVVLTALFAAQAASGAVPVIGVGDKITFADGPGASPGGAFLLTDYNSTGTISKGSFQSFCLETNETMSFGPFFTVSGISAAAKNGGSGGAVGGQDPLDVRTAWLYTQYIETPSVLNSVVGWSAASAIDRGTAMQQAIWRIEQETLFITSNTLANNLINAAGAAGWQDTGRVYVLNMVNASGGNAQDQLYITPVPEPEAYAMLAAGLGLMGFVARRRRQATAT
jgi:hypothetical protein